MKKIDHARLEEGSVVALCLERHSTGTFRSAVTLGQVVRVHPFPFDVDVELFDPCVPTCFTQESLNNNNNRVWLHPLDVNAVVFARVAKACSQLRHLPASLGGMIAATSRLESTTEDFLAKVDDDPIMEQGTILDKYA